MATEKSGEERWNNETWVWEYENDNDYDKRYGVKPRQKPLRMS